MANYDQKLHFGFYGQNNQFITVRQRLNLIDKQTLALMGADFQRATVYVELDTSCDAIKILMKIVNKSKGHQFNVVANSKLSKIKYLNPRSQYSANIVSACGNLDAQVDKMIHAAQFARNFLEKSGFNALHTATTNMLQAFIPEYQHVPCDDGQGQLSFSVESHYYWSMTQCISQMIALAYSNAEFITGNSDEFVDATDNMVETVESCANHFRLITEQKLAEQQRANTDQQ